MKKTNKNNILDEKFYKETYTDIKTISAHNHYLKHGIKENRLPNLQKFISLYPDFDINVYRNENKDLYKFTTIQLYSHYHHHGKNESRICSKKKTNSTETEKHSDRKKHSVAISVDNSKKVIRPIHIIKYPKKIFTASDLHIKNELHKLDLSKYNNYREIMNNENFKNMETKKEYINIEEFTKIDTKLNTLLLNRSDNPVYLVMGRWGGYPCFGGGESWMIDTMLWMKELNYDCYYLYTHDPYKGAFTEVNIEHHFNCTFIQYPINEYSKLIFFLKLLNPAVISHQGLDRNFFLNISIIISCPFVTGFCFWQDIIVSSSNSILNKNMLRSNLVGDNNFKNIVNKSTACYLAGEFVQEITNKVHNIKLPVINTITNKNHYYINNYNVLDAKYITIINVGHLKGGNILDKIIKKTHINIPFQIIDSQSQNGDNKDSYYKNIVEERNRNLSGDNISIYIKGPVKDVKNIYKNTRILLILSQVDETFCRCAYEGMSIGIPILSTSCGNLKHLMNGYADFLHQDNDEEWSQKINKLYIDDNMLIKMSARKCTINYETNIKNFIELMLNAISKRDIKKISITNNVSILCPWGDQGLGIQSREYYIYLKNLGYNMSVFSFKPYKSISNDKLQTDSTEWKYDNIYYSSLNREDITLEEIDKFLLKHRPKVFIIPEICYYNIIYISYYLKILGIKIVAIPNIEILRNNEIHYLSIYDSILCNNKLTYDILNFMFKKTFLLEYRTGIEYINLSKKYENERYSFFCCGGLNSLTRKNINVILESFNNIISNKLSKSNNFTLKVYIQGAEIPQKIHQYDKINNIEIHINPLSYKDIINLYKTNDIFIHLGDHEGLGLGFYESISCGTPVLTINTPPNNEIITENVNGWLINCEYENMIDNNKSIINKAKIHEKDLTEKILHIMSIYNRHNTDITVYLDYINKYPNSKYNEVWRNTLNTLI